MIARLPVEQKVRVPHMGKWDRKAYCIKKCLDEVRDVLNNNCK